MAALIRKLVTIGSSKGLILPAMMLEMLNWDKTTELELKIEGKTLVVSPIRRRSTVKGDVFEQKGNQK